MVDHLPLSKPHSQSRCPECHLTKTQTTRPEAHLPICKGWNSCDQTISRWKHVPTIKTDSEICENLSGFTLGLVKRLVRKNHDAQIHCRRKAYDWIQWDFVLFNDFRWYRCNLINVVWVLYESYRVGSAIFGNALADRISTGSYMLSLVNPDRTTDDHDSSNGICAKFVIYHFKGGFLKQNYDLGASYEV